MKKRAILLTLLILTLIIFDQLTKWLVITNIKENSITVIQNILNFTYVENKGVAFGINSNGGISNIIISIFIIIIIIRFMVKQREMTNFIDISPVFNFPTFNIADILVVRGWIAFALNMAIYTTRELKNLKKELK